MCALNYYTKVTLKKKKTHPSPYGPKTPKTPRPVWNL